MDGAKMAPENEVEQFESAWNRQLENIFGKEAARS